MGFKLLLTENQSRLGEVIGRELEEHAFTVICLPADFDWRDAQRLERYLAEQNPSLLINTLAYTGAETGFSQVLAEACARRQIPCLHLSAYRVFGTTYDDDGYGEDQIPEPDDEHGRNLLTAETTFLALDRALVLRIPWLIDSTGDNVLTRVASRLLSGEPLQVSNVYRGCPVAVDDVCRVVVTMIQQLLCGAENWGVFHLHTLDACSEAEFADCVARLLKEGGRMPGEIEILKNEESRLAPGCALLKGTRCMNNFGIQLRSWRQGIKPLVEAWGKGVRSEE